MIAPLLDATIKVSVVVLLALAGSVLLRRRAAAVRHWVLAVAIACAAVMPVLERIAPAWHVPVTSRLSGPPAEPAASVVTISVTAVTEPSDRAAASQVPPGARGQTTLLGWLAPIWIAGAVISLSILLVGLARLAWLASRSHRVRGAWAEWTGAIAQEYGLHRPVALLQSNHPTMLVTWGWMRPKILLPAAARTWDADRIRVVLCHELAHVRRGDWATQMAAEIVRSLYWFNPLAWIACRRLRDESEHACDDAVLGRGVDASEYAEHLLALARTFRHERSAWSPAPGIVRPSHLERRITAMLNTRIDRHPMTRSGRIASAAAGIALAIVIAGFAAFAQGSAVVSGTVTDPSGRPVPEANVSVTNVKTSATHAAPTDQAGAFRFSDLPEGTYRLEVKAMGFASHKAEIILAAGRSANQSVSLQIGSVQETVSVSGRDSGAPRVVDKRADPGWKGPSKFSGGSLRPPIKVKHVAPRYPQHVWDAGVEGTVVCDARIAADGSTKVGRIVSAAHPDLATAASEAVSQWEFEPTLLWGVPVEVSMKITVNFSRQ